MTTDMPDEAPLLSNRTLRRATAAVVFLVALMAAINLAGHWAGERIALAGHTDSTDIVAVTVGQDRLELPANVIRFPQARVSGPADRIDLYLAWPDMAGYSADNGALFNEIDRPGRIIFLQLSQSTMSRDMSGRLNPIYKGLFEGQPTALDAGLSLHRLRMDSGYNGEVMLTGKRDGEADYAVRCILATKERPASNADCQRDIFVGRDLSVLYRFSSTLLPEWRAIDEAVRRYVEQRLAAE